jgi:hypothetical protein
MYSKNFLLVLLPPLQQRSLLAGGKNAAAKELLLRGGHPDFYLPCARGKNWVGGLALGTVNSRPQ